VDALVNRGFNKASAAAYLDTCPPLTFSVWCLCNTGQPMVPPPPPCSLGSSPNPPPLPCLHPPSLGGRPPTAASLSLTMFYDTILAILGSSAGCMFTDGHLLVDYQCQELVTCIHEKSSSLPSASLHRFLAQGGPLLRPSCSPCYRIDCNPFLPISNIPVPLHHLEASATPPSP